MQRSGAIVSILTALVLVGCSSLPSERRFSSLGRFEQFQLNASTFQVTYVGNGYTFSQDAEEIALLESARVTLAHGFVYFKILAPPVTAVTRPQVRSMMSVEVYGAVPLYHRSGVIYPVGLPYDRLYGGFEDGWAMPNRIQVVHTIACAMQQSDDQRQFDARIILASLGPKYHLNPDGSEQSPQVQRIPKATQRP
jgi:hypothetical protein